MSNKNKNKVIRSSRHRLSFCNIGKRKKIVKFLRAYRHATRKFVNFIWNNRIDWISENKDGEVSEHVFDIQNLQLDCPIFLDYRIVRFPTILSARALSSAITQALGIIRSKTEEVRHCQWKLSQNNSDFQQSKFQRKLDSASKRMRKPKVSKFLKAEISSKNILMEITQQATCFDAWIKFQCLGFCNLFDFPIRFHKHSQQLKKNGFSVMASFLLSEDSIEIRWSKNCPRKTTGQLVGCDTGILSAATFSNGNNDHNEIKIDGRTYSDAVKIVARKRKGSKNFQGAMVFRDNLLRHILNQANFDDIKEIRFENNSSLKQGNKKGRFLAHHAYGVIKHKIFAISEELGVQVIQTGSWFRSQLCNSCFFVHQKNRKKGTKKFKCLNCWHCEDADLNASRNALLKLPWLDFGLARKEEWSKKGFFWMPSFGGEPGVSHSISKSKPHVECFSAF